MNLKNRHSLNFFRFLSLFLVFALIFTVFTPSVFAVEKKTGKINKSVMQTSTKGKATLKIYVNDTTKVTNTTKTGGGTKQVKQTIPKVTNKETQGKGKGEYTPGTTRTQSGSTSSSKGTGSGSGKSNPPISTPGQKSETDPGSWRILPGGKVLTKIVTSRDVTLEVTKPQKPKKDPEYTVDWEIDVVYLETGSLVRSFHTGRASFDTTMVFNKAGKHHVTLTPISNKGVYNWNGGRFSVEVYVPDELVGKPINYINLTQILEVEHFLSGGGDGHSEDHAKKKKPKKFHEFNENIGQSKKD
ncbi:MAG: hypothetical protein ACH0QD_13295 [Tepidibacillus sp.]